MSRNSKKKTTHPLGEYHNSNFQKFSRNKKRVECETYEGKVFVEWDEQAPVTPIGQLTFFIEFLKTMKLFLPWVSECPLQRTSPNASKKIDILGTLFLSVLSGQKRYAHITAIRNDNVNPGLLGMTKIVSEDTARKAFKNANLKEMGEWQKKHLTRTYQGLFCEPWIMDIDTTIKTLYGTQEGAEVGYNPHKPGRPAHTIHTYMMGSTRLILDAEVLPGKQTPASYTLPGLWNFLDRISPKEYPHLLRGDCAFGNEKTISEIENRGINYLFKLRKTKGVKNLVKLVDSPSTNWEEAGKGWTGVKSKLRLQGWTKKRSVVVIRRPLPKPTKRKRKKTLQLLLPFYGAEYDKKPIYEYAVLVTDLDLEILSLAQLYRDRADSENNFDELKNQWGWGGFVTQDLLRSQIMARIVAQVYNWWNLFTRLIDPNKHQEAITSRPLLLYGVGVKKIHANQTTITLSSTHAKFVKIKEMLVKANCIFSFFRSQTEQLTSSEKWLALLSLIFRKFLKGRWLHKSKKRGLFKPILAFF